ncbi:MULTISPECIES: relaxase/mobilization nuclease domain-containing protein [Spongiibacteraceae]|uniref:MobA/VirD2-like nuclease domain-containing protein n=1 Tax=Zhongshania aliphaticivorans TaxID=1470434 RepID=A0A127M2A0_9GAMM|nr:MULTISPECIES: relaxase/mobilization nuclease domain-containing protein [Spongiibacteraceae]AMO67337.1 hypothetical protein AZF00_03035 [Zhongshania aliphaticivorans]MBM7422312.1 hypothetical protein [Spongiibacter marinus]
MIPFASQRGGGGDLATHLQNEADNEQVEIAHIRGAVAHDLHGAFAEWELQAHCLTKCQKYLYSLSINPWTKVNGQMSRDQYMDYIDRVEQKLGLKNQPRAVVFHIKEGREHAHVVWSRIDAEQGKAVQLSFDREKLMKVTREFARDHDLILPDGYEPDQKEKNKQNSLYEQHQQNQTGRTKEERMTEITQAWRRADSAKGFVNALADMGYILAQGDRPYVVVDLHGHTSALPRMIDDKSVRARDVAAFLKYDYPSELLPTVDEARDIAAKQRAEFKQHSDLEKWAKKYEDLKQAHRERRKPLEAEGPKLAERIAREKAALIQKQDAEGKFLEQKIASEEQAIADKRARFNPQGLAAFLGRVSGVEFARKKLHEYQDKKRHAGQAKEFEALSNAHKRETRLQQRVHQALEHDIERRLKNLAKVEAREISALDAKFKREQSRDIQKQFEGSEALNIREHFREAAGQVRGGREESTGGARDKPDLAAQFEKAAGANQEKARTEAEGKKDLPNLTAEFDKASGADQEDGDTGGDDDNAPSHDNNRSSRPRRSRRPRRGRDRGR